MNCPSLVRIGALTLCLASIASGQSHPVVQEAYLKASDVRAHDELGSSVAAWGDTLVVGAPVVSGGKVYVFVWNGASWTQEARLEATSSDHYDDFGDCVAIWSDTIVVGAPFEDSSATGVDGDDEDDSAENAGAAYVFVRSGSTWTRQAYLKASNTEAGDYFGGNVSISGDTIIVGATGEGSGATGVNGDEQDNTLSGAGAAYVFVRSGAAWSQQAYLKASHPDDHDAFGSAVGVSGDIAVIGAVGEDSAADEVNGDENDNSLNSAGAAYVFVRNGSSWRQEAYLKPSTPDTGDLFGWAAAISGSTIVVGARCTYDDPGKAYVFIGDMGGWSEERRLQAPVVDDRDLFGGAVAIDGDVILVGAAREDSSQSGVPQGDVDSGAAYLWRREGGVWELQDFLKASNAEPDDWFGSAVALSGSVAVVGAIYEDGGSAGINGDQEDDSMVDSGAAYVFDLDPVEIGTRFCSPAVPNSTGQPGTMRLFGSTTVAECSLTLVAEDLPTGTNTGYFLMGTGMNTFIPPGSVGAICIAPGLKRYLPPVNNTNQLPGGFSRIVGTNGRTSGWITPGSTWSFQAWHRDSAAGTSNLTDAVGVTFD